MIDITNFSDRSAENQDLSDKLKNGEKETKK